MQRGVQVPSLVPSLQGPLLGAAPSPQHSSGSSSLKVTGLLESWEQGPSALNMLCDLGHVPTSLWPQFLHL